MLGERMVARAAVGLSVQETLALLRTLLESAPLGLPLRPCGPQIPKNSERLWVYYQTTNMTTKLHLKIQIPVV